MLPIKKLVYKVIWEQNGSLIIEVWKKEETNKKVYDRSLFHILTLLPMKDAPFVEWYAAIANPIIFQYFTCWIAFWKNTPRDKV
jgi:hypothetical protein